MNKENLIKLINQIRKYDLVETFKNPNEFDEWLSNLNDKQIKNFNSLTIDPSLIPFPKRLLINENLLECNDYTKRVDAMSKLTNGKGCLHLFDDLCSKNFLNSKNYYSDMELISKAKTARYALWVIDKDEFINSPYHTEDLELIVSAKDTKKENEKDCRDYLVAEALATTAKNIDSINSPYHQEDMKLIATCGSEVLQSIHSYPYYSVNTLATEKESLKDKYHLENMQILAKNPIAIKYLYRIMRDKEFINGKYYRDEVNALLNAKSKITARAIYNYITNPERLYDRELNEDWIDFGFDYNHLWVQRNENIKGNSNPKYLENLKLLNEIDDKIVPYFETLLSNKKLIASKYYEHDLQFVLTIDNQEIFMDIYRIVFDELFMSSPYHISDLEIISKANDKDIRNWLVAKARDEYSIENPNHQYDMQYISKLNFENISKERRDLMHYYLFNRTGINHPNHIEILEDIYKGESIKNYNIVSNYLDELEQQLNNSNDVINNSTNIDKPKDKVLSRIKKFFHNR